MPAILRIECWDDVQAAGGTCLAHVADASPPRETMDTITGERTLTLTIPYEATARPFLLIDRVIRLRMDPATDPGYECIERRISKRLLHHGANGLTVALTARGIIQDLGTRAHVTRTTATGRVERTFNVASLTLAAHVTAFVLPALVAAGYDWWQLGTVESDAVLSSFVYDKDTPLSALRRLADAAGLELAVRAVWDEDAQASTGYAIDLVQRIGSDQLPIAARTGKQVNALDIEESAEDQATVIAGVGAVANDGAVATLAGARWTVGAIDATPRLVTLVDPAGGAGPVGFDDQLNAFAVRWPGDAGQRDVQDSIAATQQVQLNSVAGLTVGQVVRFVVAEDGRDVDALPHPIYRAAFGPRVATLEKPEIPDTVNLVPNGALRGWHSTPAGWALDGVFPDKWTAGANLYSIEQETDPLYWRSGGYSAKCVLLAGGYLETEPIYWLADQDNPYLSALAALYVASGVVCLEVCCDATYTTAPGTLYTYPQDAGYPQVANDGEANWFTLAWSGIKLLDNNFGYLRLRIRALTDATVYIDGGQLTATAEGRAFVEGAAPTRLWQAVNERLTQYGPLATNVQSGYLDLETAGGGTLQRDVLQPGQQIVLTDPALDEVVTTRVLGWQRDWGNRVNVGLTLSNRAPELTRILSRSLPPVRPIEPVDTGKPYVPPAYPATEVLVTLAERVQANGKSSLLAIVAPTASVARYRLYRKLNGWPTDGAPGSTLDETCFICERSVQPDGGGTLADGTTCFGGRGGPAQWYYRLLNALPQIDPNVVIDYVAGGVLYVIVVPLDGQGNPGTRGYAYRTVAGALAPHLAHCTIEASDLPAGLDFYWGSYGTFDPTTQAVIDESVDGGPWVEIARDAWGDAQTHIDGRGAGYYAGDATARLVTWRWRVRALDVSGNLLSALTSDALTLRAVKPELL